MDFKLKCVRLKIFSLFVFKFDFYLILTFQETHLKGIGIVDRSVANVPCVRTLIEQHLTTNLIDRLRILFKTRERWTLDELEPYIE